MVMRNTVEKEIVELHTFFVGWLGGSLPAGDEDFSRLTSVLDDQFTLVTPAGEELQQQALLSMLQQGHGSRPQLRIWIENSQLLYHQTPLVMARYEECQETSSGPTRRLSTAVFKEDAAAINGLVWLRVHETWIT